MAQFKIRKLKNIKKTKKKLGSQNQIKTVLLALGSAIAAHHATGLRSKSSLLPVLFPGGGGEEMGIPPSHWTGVKLIRLTGIAFRGLAGS